MATVSYRLQSGKRNGKRLRNETVMLIILLLMMGFVIPAKAQANLTAAVNDKNPAPVYPDPARITKYVKSGIIDGWVKKVITEHDKAMQEKNREQTKKKSKQERARQKVEADLYNKTAYQWLHLQFDPANFRYKVLEVCSYGKEEQLLSSAAGATDWRSIPAGSSEEKILKSMTEYIDKSIEKVIMK